MLAADDFLKMMVILNFNQVFDEWEGNDWWEG